MGENCAHRTGTSYELGASSIGSAKFIHIHANRTISARSSGSFMHSASDKHSHAFARYALSAAIGTFSSQSPRDPLKGSARAYQPELARHYFVHNDAVKSLEDLGCIQMAKRHFHNRNAWFRTRDLVFSGVILCFVLPDGLAGLFP